MSNEAISRNEKLEANARYAYELINAGKSTDAIVELHTLIDKFKKYEVDAKSTYSVYRLLALAYMRLGEDDVGIFITNRIITTQSILRNITKPGYGVPISQPNPSH